MNDCLMALSFSQTIPSAYRYIFWYNTQERETGLIATYKIDQARFT